MKKITLFSIALFGAMALLNAQNIITVDNTPGAQANYDNLQTAISQAADGDIIYIHPSETNYGNINVDKPLTLIGYGHSDPLKKSMVTDINLENLASNTKISGLFVDDDILVKTTNTLQNVIIENCLVESVIDIDDGGINDLIIRGNVIFQLGSTVSSSNNYTNALITNNILLNRFIVKNHQSTTFKNNIFLNPTVQPIINQADESGTLVAQNTIFYYNDSFNTDNPNNDGVSYSNCLTFNLGGVPVTSLNGDNNLNNVDPLFVATNDNANYDPVLDDYTFQSGSLAIGAGINGEDLGIFDGGFVFDNFGFTDGIPTVNIQAISTSVAPGQNLNVIINTSNQ
jgi:hypothetical protein